MSNKAVGFATQWSMDRIQRTVNQQSATVLYYSVLYDCLLVWVLKPGVGIAQFYNYTVPMHQAPLEEMLEEMIGKLTYDKVPLQPSGHRKCPRKVCIHPSSLSVL